MKCAHAAPIELRSDAAGSSSWLWCARCGAVRVFGYIPSGANLALYRWHAPGTKTTQMMRLVRELAQRHAAEQQALVKRLHRRTHREDDGSLIDPPIEGRVTTSGGGSPDWQAEAIGKGGSLPPARTPRGRWACPYCGRVFKTAKAALAHDHECEGGR